VRLREGDLDEQSTLREHVPDALAHARRAVHDACRGVPDITLVHHERVHRRLVQHHVEAAPR
jgi:hypothetical protein